MGLRKFSIRAFLEKNFNFIAGIMSEVGLVVTVVVVSFLICLLLAALKSLV